MDTSPCNWPVSYSGCGGATLELDPDKKKLYEQMAVDYLWNWTSKVYGTCQTTIQPCRADCPDYLSTFFGSGPRPWDSMWRPVLIQGLWYNVGCKRCGDKCGCGGAAPLVLPGPVVSVESISQAGEVLPSGSYQIKNDRLLIRNDGAVWPECGLEITYTRGVEVPVGGQIAAGVLANELAKAACNDNSCKLPSRVQTITRQGVTIAMLDAFDDIEKGHTGIWIIDAWVSSVTKAPVRSKTYSPDKPAQNPRRRTWPA